MPAGSAGLLGALAADAIEEERVAGGGFLGAAVVVAVDELDDGSAVLSPVIEEVHPDRQANTMLAAITAKRGILTRLSTASYGARSTCLSLSSCH